MMSSVWQFLKKHEFWVLVAIWLALAIAEYITEDVTLAGLMGLIGIVAITRLAMHPMWKKDEQGEEKATD